MIFDGLSKRKRSLIVGMLNSDPAAYLKWSRDYSAYTFPAGNMGEAAARALRGRKMRNTRTGEYFVPLMDSQALAKIEPEIEKSTAIGKRVADALQKLRTLSLPQLKLIFGPKLWRCKGCGDFFEAADLRFRQYCTRKCGKDHEASAAVYRARAKSKAENLGRVRAALKICPQGCDRKSWVAKEARVSKNWISYAAARGEVKL